MVRFVKCGLLSLAGICLFISSYAQDAVAQKYAAYIDAADARKHLSVLSSDAFEGRETGKPGAAKAAKYIAEQFKAMGLKGPVNGSYFEDVPLTESSFRIKTSLVNKKPFTFGKDFYITGTPVSASVSANQVVFVGYGITSDNYDDLKNTNIAGKVVLVINSGEPVQNGISAVTKTKDLSDWTYIRYKRIKFLQSKKPALILAASPVVNQYLAEDANYFTSPKLAIKGKKSDIDNNVPVINITTDLADRILASSGKTYNDLKTAIDNTLSPKTQVIKTGISFAFEQKLKDVHAADVLGYLEGSDLKNEVVVFSAHYDHIGLNPDGPDKVNNGADDDGSGTTAIIEIARAFTQAKKEGHGPRRSILFLSNVGEEKGLLGSEYYTDFNPIIPLERIVTDLNIDMIGRVDPAHYKNPDYCYLIGSDKLSTELHQISEKANATYTRLTIDYKYNDPNDPEQIYYRSDHYNFAKHNIPIIFYFNGVHEDYHKPGDEISKIHFDLLVKRAQLVFYTGWEVANRDKRLVVDVKSDMRPER
ncbi:M28 family peptidase (plasmid) [Pedobacter sp. BS3]|uniref:M28 family peptidase n=1 Tax=Pedobacter sp. BS3 TaxID=2567937 RepID=UPI0011EC8244|nr:M28 family peptidase [Pedobacter sp. BS3]TZF85593.1 M28 family peptidase [Pedobacter sp. BS3]